jgi:hypothetical protein
MEVHFIFGIFRVPPKKKKKTKRGGFNKMAPIGLEGVALLGDVALLE